MLTTRPASTLRHLTVATLLLPGLMGLAPTFASAREIQHARALVLDAPESDLDGDADAPDIATPRLPSSKGALVFHGNYCGPGSRGVGLPPLDALDAACMHHDACSPPVGTGLPSCGCNARLTREASLIAHDPHISDEMRITAQFVASGAKVLACR